MSEQKLVSPLLDGFQMGDPISSHDGVRCCPAIKENSDNKYIIKILSIPASQSQLDALLLTGAFQDAAGALNYFRELADGVVREAQLHQQLARLDGFVPCEAFQVVPMDDNQLGYDVYLLTPYRRTLERHLKKNTMTHLEAVNLGLDICAALAASRRAGHIYVDLKPSNIFISDDREYLIGDLGFISMDSMKYAALPSKYRSSYTAPEMQDVFATISDTADIYALGLILYQVYNDGQLPGDELVPPANADYEMAEIIMKACHADPAQRWQDPTVMGQALVAYMQRNTINDVPIMPPVIPVAEAETPVEEVTAEEETAAEAAAADETVEAAEETEAAAEIPEETAEISEETEETAEISEETEETAEVSAETEETAEEAEPAEEAAAEEPTEVPAEEAPEVTAEETAEEVPQDSVAAALATVYDMISDEETTGDEDAAPLAAEEVSEDLSAMLAQAEELVSHEIPEPVTVHEPRLPEEEPAAAAEETAEETEAAEPAQDAAPAEKDGEDDDGEDEIDIPIAIPDLEPVKKKGKKWLAIIAIIALLAGLAYGAHYYYQNYYLVPVESIVLEGDTDQITAQVAVDIDEAILTAVCTDTYGNTTTSRVQNGQAIFTGLNPGTQYTVSLKVDGFYKLCGNNTASFTTTRQTNIVSISATTGAEDGSVILSFTVDGTDPENWTVEYAAEGQEPQTTSFTGHMVTITGLTVDSTYTFRLMPTEATDVEVVGTQTLDFTVSKVILAENVTIGSFNEDLMDIRWNAPEGALVEEWTIRRTDGGDYDQTLTVTDCAASFSGITADKTYTLEILAQGMTQSARAEVTPKLLTVTGISCTPVSTHTLRITWEYEGDAPAAGWTVEYSANGGDTISTLTSETNAADLSPIIPGTTYQITVAGVETTYEAPAAGSFSGHGITASDLSYSTCVAPAASGWDQNGVSTYTANFTAGQSVGMVVYSKSNVRADSEDVEVLYLLRYEDGTVMDWATRVRTMNWASMWKQNHFCTTLPEVPNDPGLYTIEIYFDGDLAVTKRFRIEQ